MLLVPEETNQKPYVAIIKVHCFFVKCRAVKKIRKIRYPSEISVFVFGKKRILSVSEVNRILSVSEFECLGYGYGYRHIRIRKYLNPKLIN